MGWDRERLCDRYTGVGWQDLHRKRRAFAKMRLVREQMLVEDDRSTGGPVLRATAENMVRGTTKHTAAKT